MIDLPKRHYEKQVMDLDGFVLRLQSKGFCISNIDEAKDFLSKKGYYHISAYIKCFCESIDGEDKTIVENIDFSHVILLYNLDRLLQNKILDALLEIEILIKASYIQHLSNKYQSPFWYKDPKNVTSRGQENLMDLINEIKRKGDKSYYYQHFIKKYEEEDLPIWHIVEMATFGSFTKLFDFLKDEDLFEFCEKFNAVMSYEENDLGQLNRLYYDKDQLKSWLKGLSDLRNRIAHSEISWSPKALPKIVLPFFKTGIKLNTLCSYIQLIHHFLLVIDNKRAEGFYADCFSLLSEISKISGIHVREFNKIGLNENWEKRFM